jgi:uncharacterized OB-fold protein
MSSSRDGPARPVPVPDELSAPYWEAAARHELVLPRCAACGQLDLPPEVVCRRCGSAEPRWEYVPSAGTGSVRSWTVVRQTFLPGFDTPFVLVDVELDDQADLRVIGRLVGSDGNGLRVGDRVETVFEDVGDERAVPAYRLAAGT